jgi:hypothetical protein
MDAGQRVLCTNVCDRIIAKYGHRCEIGNFPEIEQTAVLVCTATGIIENGGFEYLFGSLLPGDSHYARTLDAFGKVGATKAADAIRRAFELFPQGIPPDEDGIRIELFKRHLEGVRDVIDVAFFNALDEIFECLSDYIVKNGLHKKWGGN